MTNLTPTQIRKAFDQMIDGVRNSNNPDPDTIARLELECEYFSNEEFAQNLAEWMYHDAAERSYKAHSPEAVRATFVKSFTAGTFKGMTATDGMAFVSEQAAQDWRDGVNRNNARGMVDYRVIGLTTEKL